jgi:class 3 adenylate cyclase
MSIAEAAAAAGTSPDHVERLRIASGLPPVARDEPACTEADVETFRNFAAAASLFGDDATVQFVRVLGASLARIADAAIALFIVNVELPVRAMDASPLAVAKANLAGAEAIGVLPRIFEALLRAHLEAAVSRQRRARHGERGDLVVMTVGFVDLVGFTPLAGRLSAGELGTIVERFEGLASDVAVSRGGRIVKSIGDAVMFVAPRADVGCDIALTLLEGFADDPVVRPRGGLARGETLMRGGDYYGPVVNLAARIGDLAVPREILGTAAVVDDAGGAPFRFDAAGRRMLKGVEDPQLVYTAVRR